nr:hypothetical protein [Caedibacter taeniospiralis]
MFKKPILSDFLDEKIYAFVIGEQPATKDNSTDEYNSYCVLSYVLDFLKAIHRSVKPHKNIFIFCTNDKMSIEKIVSQSLQSTVLNNIKICSLISNAGQEEKEEQIDSNKLDADSISKNTRKWFDFIKSSLTTEDIDDINQGNSLLFCCVIDHHVGMYGNTQTNIFDCGLARLLMSSTQLSQVAALTITQTLKGDVFYQPVFDTRYIEAEKLIVLAPVSWFNNFSFSTNPVYLTNMIKQEIALAEERQRL